MFKNALMKFFLCGRGASSITCISQPAVRHSQSIRSLPLSTLFSTNFFVNSSHIIPVSINRSFSTLFSRPIIGLLYNQTNTNVSNKLNVTASTNKQQSRTVVRCSMNKGKKKTVKAVVARFYRLSNGLWIRRYAGYKKKLFMKSLNRKKRIKNHIFCNKTQSKMLDLMVTRYWRERKYYVDHPYEKYQERNFNGFKTWPGEKIAHANYEKVTKHGYRMKEM